MTGAGCGWFGSETTGMRRGILLLPNDGLDDARVGLVMEGVSVREIMAGAGCGWIDTDGVGTTGAGKAGVIRVDRVTPGVILGVLITMEDGLGDTRVGLDWGTGLVLTTAGAGFGVGTGCGWGTGRVLATGLLRVMVILGLELGGGVGFDVGGGGEKRLGVVRLGPFEIEILGLGVGAGAAGDGAALGRTLGWDWGTPGFDGFRMDRRESCKLPLNPGLWA